MVKETIPADEAFQPLSTSKSRLVGQSEARAKFANLYRLTRPAVLDHDRAKAELKAFVPEDTNEASGHGVRAKRSKSGAITFGCASSQAVSEAPWSHGRVSSTQTWTPMPLS